MYPVWWWGIVPHPHQRPPPPPLPPPPELTTPTTTKTITTTITSTIPASSISALSSSPHPSIPSHPPLISTEPSAPHENQPSQVCSEKHRGGPSSSSSTSSSSKQNIHLHFLLLLQSHPPPPPPKQQHPTISPSHRPIPLLYETCRRYLTLSLQQQQQQQQQHWLEATSPSSASPPTGTEEVEVEGEEEGEEKKVLLAVAISLLSTPEEEEEKKKALLAISPAPSTPSPSPHPGDNNNNTPSRVQRRRRRGHNHNHNNNNNNNNNNAAAEEEVILYFIQGCNIVQIMPPTTTTLTIITPPTPPPPPPSPTTKLGGGDSEIRSNIANNYSTTKDMKKKKEEMMMMKSSINAPLPPHPLLPYNVLATTDSRNSKSKCCSNSNSTSSSSSRSSSSSSRSRRSRSSSSSSSSLSQSVFLLTMLCLLLAGGSSGSELPDRECCDSLPPPPPNYHHATSTTTTTTTPTPKLGFNSSIAGPSHGTGGEMNCVQARHQCLNDKQCADVLSMLHKVCGPELVACATTTPSKCRMLLRTLSNFDYLQKCGCGLPHLDFVCHNFRETIFNHPCEQPDDYSTTLMPNCNDMYVKCRDKASCLRDYLEFANTCTFSGITCTAQESDRCTESWNKIRQGPLFGCICSPPPQLRVLAYGSDMGHDSSSITNYSTLRKGTSDRPESCMETYNRTHENPCLAGQQDVQKATLIDSTQATCHTALDKCQSDPKCRPLFADVMVWCEHSHCEPDRCRSALQDFYDRVSIIHRLRVAFCVCRQSDPDGECLTAMRKLHPTCAERQLGRDSLKCHKIADQCRKNGLCRKKLEDYEQKCAADAMTGRCASDHRSCQQAVMNILGTELHASCVCKGTDFLHQHDCYTWQKLLWSNPCVIESHLMLHKEIAEGSNDKLDEVFRRPTVRTTPTPRIPQINPTPDETDFNGEYGVIQEYSHEVAAPRPQGTYGYERTGIWDTGRRNGGISLGRDRIRGGAMGRDNGREGPSINIGGGGYNSPKGGLDSSRGSSRNGGISVVRGGDNRRVYAIPDVDFQEPSWNGGRSHGNGFGVVHSGGGGRNGGHNGRLSPSFGGRNQEETGSGGRWRTPHRQPALNVGRDPDRGRDRVHYEIDPPGPGNGYSGRGRAGAGTGHRGTPISMVTPDRDSGSVPDGGRGWNTGGGRGGSLGRGRAEYPDMGGRGGGGHDDRTYPVTRTPVRPPGFELVTPPVMGGPTPTPPALPAPTSQTSTTTPIPTTTEARRTCTIKNIENNKQMAVLHIPEGGRRRIYNTSDCSALCECRATMRLSPPEAVCTMLRCIENKECKTQSANYPHSAPYYQAYRGVCDCYAGNFICQKPKPGEYDLGPGVFMFLGYSKGEMEILRPVTSNNELDALSEMEDILIKDYGFQCTLTLKHHSGENVIAVANLRINSDVYISSSDRQRREKEECAVPLQELAEKINARPRHLDILTDAHLSMFILAEVDVHFPEARTSVAAAGHLRPDFAVTILATMLTLLIFNHHHHQHHHNERMRMMMVMTRAT